MRWLFWSEAAARSRVHAAGKIGKRIRLRAARIAHRSDKQLGSRPARHAKWESVVRPGTSTRSPEKFTRMDAESPIRNPSAGEISPAACACGAS